MLTRRVRRRIILGMGELHLNIYVEGMRREITWTVLLDNRRWRIERQLWVDQRLKKQTGSADDYARLSGIWNVLGVFSRINSTIKSLVDLFLRSFYTHVKRVL